MDKNEKQQGYPAKTGVRGGENNVSKNIIVSPNWGVDWSGFKLMKGIDTQNKESGYNTNNNVGGGVPTRIDGNNNVTNFTE